MVKIKAKILASIKELADPAYQDGAEISLKYSIEPYKMVRPK